jgi:hypothetical protein
MYKYLVILLILIIFYLLYSCESKPIPTPKPRKKVVINEHPIIQQEYINYTTPRVEPEYTTPSIEPEYINYVTTQTPIITPQPIKNNNVIEQVQSNNSKKQNIFYYEPINYN